MPILRSLAPSLIRRQRDFLALFETLLPNKSMFDHFSSETYVDSLWPTCLFVDTQSTCQPMETQLSTIVEDHFSALKLISNSCNIISYSLPPEQSESWTQLAHKHCSLPSIWSISNLTSRSRVTSISATSRSSATVANMARGTTTMDGTLRQIQPVRFEL